MPSTAGAPRVLATETFLADIAQNVAGDRLQVESLIPLGMDPHAFDPAPQDVRQHHRESGSDREWGRLRNLARTAAGERRGRENGHRRVRGFGQSKTRRRA